MRTETEHLIREALNILTVPSGVLSLDWVRVGIAADLLSKALEVEPVGRDSAWNLAERSGQNSR